MFQLKGTAKEKRIYIAQLENPLKFKMAQAQIIKEA